MMWLIYGFAYVCFVYNIVYHFKRHNSSGKINLKKREERQVCKYLNASIVILCFVFEIDAADN